MTKKWLAAGVGLGLGIALLYVFWLRQLVEQSFYGTAPGWFMGLINSLYPRFAVEKHRFELAFFLRHADQIVIRLELIGLFLCAFFWAKDKATFGKSWQAHFWNVQEPAWKIRLYVWAVYACVLFFSYDWFWTLTDLHQARAFYKPLLVLRLLHLPFPEVWVIGVLCVLLTVSCVVVVFRFRQILFSFLVAMVFTLLQAWIYSFEKLDHSFAPLTYVLWLMPLVLHQTRKNQPQWALSLIRLIIGMVYLQAGLEKLLIGGVEWLAPDTFRNYLFLHPTAAGLWVAQYDWLCVVLSSVALLFQLSFISLVLWPKLRWVLLSLGILFHTGTFVLMGVGGVINAWVWLYVLYV
jgi:hypothetical protein